MYQIKRCPSFISELTLEPFQCGLGIRSSFFLNLKMELLSIHWHYQKYTVGSGGFLTINPEVGILAHVSMKD